MNKIKISELPQSTSYDGLVTIGTNADNSSVKVSLAPVGEIAGIKAAAASEHKIIRQSIRDAVSEQHDTLAISGIVAFDGFVGDVSGDGESVRSAPIVRDPEGKVQQGAATVHYDTGNGCWAIKQDGAYYDAWDDDYLWQDAQQVPWAGKAYYNVRDGKLYRYSSTDNQLHEIALAKLRDDVGILPCRVRTAAPLSPMEGTPTGKYTIWYSQTSKAFFAAVDYDAEEVGDAIEGCECYKLSACAEYADYCMVSGKGETVSATPRTDRIYRDGNVLWQYDKTTQKMVRLNDISGGTYDSVQLTGFSQAEHLDAQQIAAELVKTDMAQLDKNDETAGLTNTVIVQAQARGMSVDWETSYKTKRVMTLKNMRDEMIYTDEQETLALGDDDSPLNVTGVRTLEAESVSAKTEVSAKTIQATGNIASFGEVSGLVVHGDKKLILDKEDVGAMLIHVFHGIRQSLPSDYTAATMALTPKTRTDGVADIIYVREKKRFYAFWEAQASYSERFDGEAEYNVIANNKPTTARTDRTWQWGADTYKYDTEAYISQYKSKGNDVYGADLVCVTDAGKALFIKMWREAMYRPMIGGGRAGYINDSGVEQTSWWGACDDLGNCYVGDSAKFQLDYGGYYPEWHETPGFFINGITGISYAEARQIYEMRTTCPYPRPLCETNSMRTNMMCDYVAYIGGGQDGRGINTNNAFSSYDVQVIRVAGGLRGQRPTSACWIRGVFSFYNADSLEEIIGAVQVGTLGDTAFNSIFSPFKSKLKYLWIMDLSVSLTKTFAKASAIDIDCLRYLVEKSRATAAKPISVTLHADVFAALPEDILTLAETKYVTFVSA